MQRNARTVRLIFDRKSPWTNREKSLFLCLPAFMERAMWTSHFVELYSSNFVRSWLCAKRVLVFNAHDAKACASESSIMRVMWVRATAHFLLVLWSCLAGVRRQLWLELTAMVCMDVSLQSSVLMYCTNMESVASLHTTFLHSVQILKVHWDSYERFSKSADINCSNSKTCGHFSRTLISGHSLRSGHFLRTFPLGGRVKNLENRNVRRTLTTKRCACRVF